LRGDAADAFGESGGVAGLLARGEFALWMGVEISAVAVDGEHEEEFGVEARGRDVVRGEAGDGGGERRLQLHLYISTQSGCGREVGGFQTGRANTSRTAGSAGAIGVPRFARDDKTGKRWDAQAGTETRN